MSTHPTAEEIAKEAVFEACPGLQSGLSEDTAEVYKLRAIILTAARRIAAQMVRDSGAVAAMADVADKWDAQDATAKTEIACDDAVQAMRAALAKLRAITEQP